MPQLAYSYVRMSTPKQAKGDSLRRQTEASRRYCEVHGLVLDETLDLYDMGVSAFNGDNAVTGALSRFMSAIDHGLVAPGSYLLVESLDRLSRQRVGAAMAQFLSIVERGITIVTLSDSSIYRPGASDPMPLIQSLLIMSRAHEESLIKSQRLSAAWENKRNRISERKLTARCPLWLRVTEDRSSFIVDDTRAAVVRTIFRLAAEGFGHYAICKKLNGDGIQPFGKAPGWGESYVEKIVRSRAVIGEFQAYRLVGGQRLPVGDPIRDYYPTVIDEEMFLAVQAARRSRSVGGGGRRGAHLSLGVE